LRSYEATGIQQTWSFENQFSDAVRNLFQAGWRYHGEDQERLQVNANTPTGRSGTVVENNSRDTKAFSLWASNTFEFDQFSITPIARFESIDNGRTNNLTGASGSDEIDKFIPGISVGYDINSKVKLFAGVHEGFAPPRVEDVIDNSGGSVDLDADSSINVEAGFKSEVVSGIVVDGTYFRNDFDNLIAVGSIAGGSTPIASGEALFEGVELYSRIDSGKLLRKDWSLYGSVAWTYLWTAEQTTPYRAAVGGWKPSALRA
jgi:Fe(3+) dicitrate transport protein